MKQILAFASVAFSTGSTTYRDILGGMTQASTFETSGESVWLPAGTFRNFRIRLVTAPGAGKSWTLTLRVANTTTAMSVVIADTDTEGVYTGDVTVSAGAVVSLKSVPSGSPTAMNGCFYSLEFESALPYQSGYAGRSGGGVNLATPKYVGAFTQNLWNATLDNVESIAAAPGTITQYAVRTVYGFGAWSGTKTFHILVNGVAQDGTGGTTDTTIVTTSADNNTTKTLACAVPIARGDRVAIRQTPSNHNQDGIASNTSVLFTADTDGYSQFCGGDAGNLVATAPGRDEYPSNRSDNGWETLGNAALDAALTSFTLKDLHVATTGAPGSGKSWTFSGILNAAIPAGAPSVTIADAATSGADLVNVLAIVDGDTFSFRHVPSGSPAVERGNWGFVQDTGASVPPGPGTAPSAGSGLLIQMCFGGSYRTWLRTR